MKDLDILQWTMGWSWPIITVLAVLIAWGIGRFLTWDEKNPAEESTPGPAAQDRCVCDCGRQ